MLTLTYSPRVTQFRSSAHLRTRKYCARGTRMPAARIETRNQSEGMNIDRDPRRVLVKRPIELCAYRVYTLSLCRLLIISLSATAFKGDIRNLNVHRGNRWTRVHRVPSDFSQLRNVIVLMLSIRIHAIKNKIRCRVLDNRWSRHSRGINWPNTIIQSIDSSDWIILYKYALPYLPAPRCAGLLSLFFLSTPLFFPRKIGFVFFNRGRRNCNAGRYTTVK